MSEQHEVPGPAAESGKRMQDREYGSDFARLPDSETQADAGPGAGPAGTVTTGGTNLPVVVMAVGALIVFSTFFFRSIWAVAIGLVVLIAGAIWSGVSGDSSGSRGGTGPTMIDY